jgi:hypothetical protein
MAVWAAEQSRETLQSMGSKRGKAPSERTYRRLFASIDDTAAAAMVRSPRCTC